MEQTADNIATQEPPGNLSNQEMERLLEEAASLSEEITSEGDDHPDDPSSEPEPQPAAPEEQAAEAIFSDEPEAMSPTTDRGDELPDLLHDPDTSLTATPPQAEASATPEAQAKNDGLESTDLPRKPETPETQPEEAGQHQEGEGRPGGEDHRNSADREQESSQNPQTDAEGETEPPATKKLGLKRLAVFAGSAFRFAGLVPMAALNACLRTVVLLDRPFCRLPMDIKRALGIVAVATLLMGIGAWILPNLLNHNPFADMDRYTQTMR